LAADQNHKTPRQPDQNYAACLHNDSPNTPIFVKTSDAES